MYSNDERTELRLNTHETALVMVDILERLIAELFTQFNRFVLSFDFILLNFVEIVLTLLLLATDFLAFTDIVNPISEVNNVVSVGGVLAGVLELLVCFEFEELIVVGLRKIFEVNVCQAGNEVFTVIMQKRKLLESRPIIL
jgi:hypothetical protein